MRVLGIGPTELAIVFVIVLLWLVPVVLSAIGMYRIATKAGYDSGAAILWTIAYVFFSWLIVLLVGLLEWPRDRAVTPVPVPGQQLET